ncbi:MAG: NTP transferase domain-containing protein [Saprospiraceae bacterium]|nr:NTP transferase domain-containing protein [Saprospiraceae bacterium]
MKAIIPVAGAGTRLRPHTYTQPKPLLPVAGKPIICFIIDKLIESGIGEFVFVIGYLGEKVKLFIEQQYPDLAKEFVWQHERQGLGHAIWMARNAFKHSDEIFIVLGDTIFDVNINEMFDVPHSCLAIKRVNDPREFGVVEVSESGIVTKVVEKPKIPKSNNALVGLYKIKEVNLLIDCLEYNILNNVRTHGEFQLADGLMRMIERGVKFTTKSVNNWFDCGKREILLETNAMLLDQEGYASGDNEIPVFDNTIIIHPVSIGKNCNINNSIIGPHVTIGSDATISSSIIKNSIIGSFTLIEETVLWQSIIGSDTAIKGLRQSLNIGDNTEIDFS